MRRIYYRLCKEMTLPFIIIASLSLIVIASIQIYRNSKEPEIRWSKYRVNNYSLDDGSLKQQINSLYEERSRIEESEYFAFLTDEIRQIDDDLNILRYLQEQRIAYDDVIDGTCIAGKERSQVWYSYSIFEFLTVVNIALMSLLLYRIVVFTKNNGTFYFDCIFRGRLHMFRSQLGISFLIGTSFFLCETSLVFLIRSQFVRTARYLIGVDGNNVIMRNEITVMFLQALNCYLVLLVTFLIQFALSQVLDSPMFFFALGNALPILINNASVLFSNSYLGKIMQSTFGYRFIDSTERPYIICGIILKIGLAFLTLFISYFNLLRRKY